MRSNSNGRSAQSQLVLGVLVIVVGGLFLLDNLGIVDVRHALGFWPLALIVLGVVKLFDTSSPNAYLFGVVLVALGVTMVARRLGLFYLGWQTVWPLLLIALGGLVVYRATTARRAPLPSLKDEPGSDALVDVTAILGGIERRVVTPAFRGGEVTALLGGCELDLRGASIEGEAVLNVFAVFGGITIKCPPDWSVVLDGTPVLGGFHEKTAAAPDASKRLTVRGYAIMGGVEVRN